jgi:hypothetical protein
MEPDRASPLLCYLAARTRKAQMLVVRLAQFFPEVSIRAMLKVEVPGSDFSQRPRGLTLSCAERKFAPCLRDFFV